MRHAYRAAAIVVWLALSVGGCAAISGLSDITEQECAPTCDGGTTPDATMINHGDSAPPSSDDAPATEADSSRPPESDAPVVNDAPATTPETGSDAPVSDAPVSSDAPISTTTCGGNACASGDAGCCGSECPFAHNYDEDTSPAATFYDCVAVGTYNATLALDACAAFTGDKAQCDSMGSYYCELPNDGGLAGDMVCSDGPKATACQCWGYSGVIAGELSTAAGCECPEGAATAWK
jgi:hypothetical protein